MTADTLKTQSAHGQPFLDYRVLFWQWIAPKFACTNVYSLKLGSERARKKTTVGRSRTRRTVKSREGEYLWRFSIARLKVFALPGTDSRRQERWAAGRVLRRCRRLRLCSRRLSLRDKQSRS